MARRTKQEAEATRDLLLDAAETVFREKGVSHSTLADIATVAGVTRGAIYWHFENKAALLQAVNDRAQLPFDAIHQLIADVTLENPLAALRAGALQVMESAVSNERLRRVFEILLFKCEYVDEMAGMLERRRQNRDECVRAIMKNLGHAVAKGQLPEALDVGQAALGMYALVDGLFVNWLMDHQGFDLVAQTGSQIDVYLSGLDCK